VGVTRNDATNRSHPWDRVLQLIRDRPFSESLELLMCLILVSEFRKFHIYPDILH